MQQVLAAETNGAGLVAVAVAAQTPSGARDQQQSQRQHEKTKRPERSCDSVQLHLCAPPAVCTRFILNLILGRRMKSQGGQSDA